MVEELLSKAGTIGQETAKAIADAAMLEVASTTRGKMVTRLSLTLLYCTTDQIVYEVGI